MSLFETQVLEDKKYHFWNRNQLSPCPQLPPLCCIFLPAAPGLLNLAGDAAYFYPALALMLSFMSEWGQALNISSHQNSPDFVNLGILVWCLPHSEEHSEPSVAAPCWDLTPAAGARGSLLCAHGRTRVMEREVLFQWGQFLLPSQVPPQNCVSGASIYLYVSNLSAALFWFTTYICYR